MQVSEDLVAVEASEARVEQEVKQQQPMSVSLQHKWDRLGHLDKRHSEGLSGFR